jgi:hypothetical protein
MREDMGKVVKRGGEGRGEARRHYSCKLHSMKIFLHVMRILGYFLD